MHVTPTTISRYAARGIIPSIPVMGDRSNGIVFEPSAVGAALRRQGFDAYATAVEEAGEKFPERPISYFLNRRGAVKRRKKRKAQEK